MKFNAVIIIILFFIFPVALSDLKIGFYSSSCPKAEEIVRQVVQKNFNRDRYIAAPLIRLHFHDCYVRGCDASILIDSTRKSKSEKDATLNKSLKGFEVIDEAKSALEKACPSTVSCADIITLAARDAVSMAGGLRYDVPTGRRDGMVSNISEVNLPGAGDYVSLALKEFASKGFTLKETVTLLGAHTVGFTHCTQVRMRLVIPTMDPDLRVNLLRLCNSKGKEKQVALDQNTSLIFDNQFYKQILLNRGVLPVDQYFAWDNSTNGIVSHFATDNESFLKSYAEAAVKLGKIGVVLGNQGEIRKNCRLFNYNRP